MQSLRTMHRKLPSFSFTGPFHSEPHVEDRNGSDHQDPPRKSRSYGSLFKLRSRSPTSRSPSPYAGRSKTGGRWRRSPATSEQRDASHSDYDTNDEEYDAESDAGTDAGRVPKSPMSSQERLSIRGSYVPNTAYDESDAGSDVDYLEHSDLYYSDDEEDGIEDDPEVVANTEANAGSGKSAVEYLIENQAQMQPPEPLDDGPNLVKSPHSPFSPTTPTVRQPRQRKPSHREEYPLKASRAVYERNRCTVTLTHGDPEGFLAGQVTHIRRKKKYVVASDLSEEAYYAIEWAVGTVLRNGDELLFVTVVETDSKLDPESTETQDKAAKVRNQQERHTRAMQLSREATALLERTRLHVTVVCQAIHAKNARHMLVDLIDYIQPTLVITGSRGLSELKGIILGSVSHYLVQKSSSPVMVTRRRLKPQTQPRRPISDLQRKPRVTGLANAAVEKESHAAIVSGEASDTESNVEVQKHDGTLLPIISRDDA